MNRPIKNLTPVALLTLTLLSVSVYAGDDYAKYEKRVNGAKIRAERSLKTGDSKLISSAHYQLAAAHSDAREHGHVCDLGYTMDIVSSLQVAADHSAWFQKKLPMLPAYQRSKPDSLQLQLIAAGLTKNTPMSREQFLQTLQNIFAQSDVTLHKAQPGVIPLGDIRFVKGRAINTSIVWTDAGEVKTERAPPVKAAIESRDGHIMIVLNGKASYVMEVSRDERVVTDDVRSSDDISIKAFENGQIDSDYIRQLFVSPDECSA